MTVLDMKKVRSVLTMSQPKNSDSISLPGGLQLQLEKEVSVSLRSVTDYYFAMRVLAHAWAWAGNFMVTVDKQTVLFMELSAALHYTVIVPSVTLWSSAMGACYGQWALDSALRETHLEWRSPAVQPLAEVVEPKPPKRGAESTQGSGDRKRLVKADAFRTVSQVKGGQKICKPWNDGRGCSDPKCQALHCCDVRLESGAPCLDKKHTRLEHQAA
eukprot:s4807_g4.t1